MVLSSLKTNVQATAYPPVWLFRPTLQNYVDVFTKNPFFSYMVNSTIIAGAAVGIGLVCGLPAAYSMARHRQAALGSWCSWSGSYPGSRSWYRCSSSTAGSGSSTPSAESSSPTSSSSCR